MSQLDTELEQLREVSCSALLERLPPPWQLDKAESTKNCLKYRRGRGEIILVTHGDRGWWDAGSATARGDVFNLVQHLQHTRRHRDLRTGSSRPLVGRYQDPPPLARRSVRQSTTRS